jgi:hypothetical protein
MLREIASAEGAVIIWPITLGSALWYHAGTVACSTTAKETLFMDSGIKLLVPILNDQAHCDQDQTAFLAISRLPEDQIFLVSGGPEVINRPEPR